MGGKHHMKHLIPVIVILLLLSTSFVGIGNELENCNDRYRLLTELIITGPILCKVGIKSEYSIYLIEPEAEVVWFSFNFGDGEWTEWIGPYESYEKVVWGISWPACGVYTIQTIAKCNESYYNASLVITVIDYNIIYVDDDNTEGPWEGTFEHPYQHIQDGIDNSNNGDTVFVYNGTYFEILNIDKTINLAGENRENTIIDANGESDAIYIYSPNVTINNFRIQNAVRAGINLNSNTTDNINISNNIFCFNAHGIHPYFSNENLIISDNIFFNNNNGFTLVCSSNAKIYQNQFINNSQWAMGFYLSSSSNVFYNNITNGKKYGVFLYGLSRSNYFHHNNFFNNSMNAYFILLSIQNKWNENYWEKPLSYPYPIIGSIGMLIPCWINFDWHPVKEPYDIGV